MMTMRAQNIVRPVISHFRACIGNISGQCKAPRRLKTTKMVFCSPKYTGDVRLDGKTAIITGCNTGIGKFTALDLYKRGCRVIMACRDQTKAEASRQDIIKTAEGATRVGEVILMPLDLSSLQSVRELAKKIMEEEVRIDILICNAGVMMCPKGETKDGFETQFGTNHLGHFLLTLLLLPRILATGDARIVVLSSLAHSYATIDWDNLNAEKSYSATNAYCVSKLANILFVKELAKRLEGTPVKVYAVHPGVVNTDISRHADSYFPGATWLYQKVGGIFQKNEEQGAATTLHCAVDPKAGSESGLYYADCKPKSCSSKGADPALAKQMWDVSISFVKLNDFNPFKAVSLNKA